MRLLVLIFALSVTATAQATEERPPGLLSDVIVERSVAERRAREAQELRAELEHLRELESRLAEAKRLRAGDVEAMERLHQFEARLTDLKEQARRTKGRSPPCVGDCWLPGEGPSPRQGR